MQRESGGCSLPPSHADGAEIWNSPGPQPPSDEGQQSSQPPEQEDRPHKFQPGPDWHMVTPSKTGIEYRRSAAHWDVTWAQSLRSGTQER